MYYKDSTQAQDSITIRPSRPDDADALRRLAERDSTELPGGELLVAFVGDELRAAIPVTGGRAIADPFHPTGELVRLLSARAKQLHAISDGPRRGLRGMLRDAPRPAA